MSQRDPLQLLGKESDLPRSDHRPDLWRQTRRRIEGPLGRARAPISAHRFGEPHDQGERHRSL